MTTWKDRTLKNVRDVAREHAGTVKPGDDDAIAEYEERAAIFLEDIFSCIKGRADSATTGYTLEKGHWGVRHPSFMYQDAENLEIDATSLSDYALEYLSTKWMRCYQLDWFFVYTLCYAAFLAGLRFNTQWHDNWFEYKARAASKTAHVLGFLILSLGWSTIKLGSWLAVGYVVFQVDPVLTIPLVMLFIWSRYQAFQNDVHYRRAIEPLVALNAVLGHRQVQADALLARMEAATSVTGFEPGLYEMVLTLKYEQEKRRRRRAVRINREE
jgi:hypothetical protein